jgi:NhaP-type Na+/H+ or K+/H+ antiporter
VEQYTVLVIAGIGVVTIACQWFAWWVKLPAILFLLLAGILAGPVAGWLQPDELFGDLLFPFVSLSVAVVLFEGSLTLRFAEIRGLEQVVRRMVSSGLLVTWVVVALATYYLLAFPASLAVLFGAIAVVTGPTVIVPMLRTVRPNARISNVLRWEGIVVDPLGALLAVLVFEFIISDRAGAAWGHTLWTFARVVAVGLVFGIGSGYLMGLALRHHRLPEYLHNVAALALVFAVFALSDLVEAEAGLLAVTVMGMWLANMPGVNVGHILDFKESLSLMLISTLFIVLAARLDFSQVQQLGWAAAGVLAIIQFVARPLKVALSTRGSTLSWRERALLGWIAPRGIVAAAVAALFAFKLQAAGYPQAELLVPLTFLVIIGTVVLQSATAGLLARLLGVADPEPRGFLIVGANPIARVIAGALHTRGFATLLCDTSWANVSAARMHGLTAFYGSAVSEYADRRLDLVGLGRLLALSPQQEANVLAVHRYRREFGDKHLYVVGSDNGAGGSKQSASLPAGYIAFGQDVTYGRLSAALAVGADIHETALSENFDFDDYYRRYYKKAIPLFAVDPRGKLHVFAVGRELRPGPGWRLLSLVEPDSGDGPDEPEQKDDAQSANDDDGGSRSERHSETQSSTMQSEAERQ